MAVNTPFTGWTVKGKTLMTFVDGALAWSEGLKRLLILEDGTVFEGKAFGAEGNVVGEVVLLLA